MARVISLQEVAEMLGFAGKYASQRAKRWLIRHGIAQRAPSGHVYTTVRDVASLSDQGLINEWMRRDG
jgi:P2-related tail formation protein